MKEYKFVIYEDGYDKKIKEFSLKGFKIIEIVQGIQYNNGKSFLPLFVMEQDIPDLSQSSYR